MPDYNQLRAICRNESEISKTVVDDFLVYYAATRDKVDQEFERKISRFSHIEREMPSNWRGLIKAQFIGYQIFKAGGLIRKYLNHSSIKELKPEERDYLKKMAGHPWRFSFGEIRASPDADFYEMEDVFTGELYLLYSRSMSQTLSEHSVLLWFNLIGYNGRCWQTYGPVIPFKSFSPDDIFFYATEVDPGIESEADLTEDMDENPVRYIILTAGSNYPLIESRGHEIVQVYGQGHSDSIDVQSFRNVFKVEYAESVFKLSHPMWSEPPHSSEAYYAEKSGAISLTALTDKGYHEMASLLNKQGANIPADPDIRIHLPILTLMEKLFKRRPELHPYSRLFETKASQESEELMAKLNKFMALALPYVNSDKEPDVDALAREAGVDPETARGLLMSAMKKIKEMRK